MKTALVTGAAGFIGCHLCERLLAEGYAVRGLDSFTPHYPRVLKEQNLADLRNSPSFSLHERDIAGSEVDDLVQGVDVVFHLAARPGVRDSWVEFNEYVHSNIVGTKRLLDACAGRPVRFVCASSSSVYGNARELPVTEGAPLHPISPYGASKVMTETMAEAYAYSHGLDVVRLRYFSVYGPRQRPDMGVARFLEAAATGGEITVFGDGRQLRDMTYVGDAVQATIGAADLAEPGTVYNIASGEPRALVEVLDTLGEILSGALRVRHTDPQVGDVRDTWADITRARDDLGYEPSTALREGLSNQVTDAAERKVSAVSHSDAHL